MKFFDRINERKNRIVTAGIMAATEAQTLREESASKPRSKTAMRAKKIITVAATLAIAATMFCMTAFADTGLSKSDVSTFVGEAEGAFTTVIVLIGAALAFVGIVNYLEGHSQENDAAKSKGMKMLMGGLGVAILGFVAVPALFDLIETALK